MTTDDVAPAGYEYAAVAPPGSILFTAGACPLDGHGDVVAGGLGAQARCAVDNLLTVLARHGADPGDLVRTTVYVVGEREDLAEVWGVVSAALAPAHPPSTLLGVAVLGYPGQVVEIDGIAVVRGSAEH